MVAFEELNPEQLRKMVEELYEAIAKNEATISERDAEIVRLTEENGRQKSDSAKLAAEARRLRRLLGIDFLTGIPNRHRIERFLENEIARCRRKDDSIFCVLFLDIDHFRKVNEELGHEGGSAVLRELAQRLQAALRRSDAIGRYGGEEFLIVLPDTPSGGAKVAAERLCKKIIADKPFTYKDKAMTVTVSIGIAEFRREDTMPDLIEAADIAMYQAKEEGRNRVVCDGRP